MSHKHSSSTVRMEAAMSIAVLSDIHGNFEALKACVNYALEKGVKTFLFLGDYLGDFAYPQRTMAYLYQLRDSYHCFFIRGNKEDYWLNYLKAGANGWKAYNTITGSLYYTYQNLTHRDLDFFDQMEIAQIVTLADAEPITICHGSPFSNRENIHPEEQHTSDILKHSPTRLILCGHTHIQQKIELDEKIALNPGSVGSPIGVCRKAQFMLLHQHGNAWEEEFLSLDYPIQKEINQLYAAELDKIAPYWCKATLLLLQSGISAHSLLLQKAMELCQKDRGECIWPDIPEQYCKQAYELLVEQVKHP